MKRFAALTLLVLLTACRLGPEGAPPVVDSADRPADWPPYAYREAAATAAVYALDPGRSSIDVVVRREGPLARFGHDHVLSPTGLQGWFLAADRPQASRADLRFATGELAIDEATARERHALDTTPDAAAIAGTRENLLREVLRREDWPDVAITLDELVAVENGHSASLSVRWGGVEYRLRRPLTITRTAREVRLAGAFRVRQTELGMTPLAILGGGLRVRDEIEVHLDLRGARVD